jgi:hypothetical protein
MMILSNVCKKLKTERGLERILLPLISSPDEMERVAQIKEHLYVP